MLLASMLGSPQGGSGVSSSSLQRQIARTTCAYGFNCQFKESPMVVATRRRPLPKSTVSKDEMIAQVKAVMALQ